MPKNATLSFTPGQRPDGSTVQEWVYQELRKAIMYGAVPPGRAVTVRAITEFLGVSAMPVRDALRRLVAERALEVMDNRRMCVPQMTPAKFDELLSARVALETLAAERALPMLNEQRIEQLEAIDAAQDVCLEKSDIEGNLLNNFEFHRYMYDSTPSQVLIPLIESLWLQLGPFMRLAMSHLAQHYSEDRHAEALAAIRRQDPVALKIAIEADIRDGIGHLGKAELLNAYLRESQAA